jgi:hypothetical protein
MSSEKVLRPLQKRDAVEYLLAAYRIGVRRGCRLMMQSRTVYNYRSHRDDRAITQRIREIAETRIRYGCPRIHILLREKAGLLTIRKRTVFTVLRVSIYVRNVHGGM